jgi:hypothetical protein
VPLVGGIFSAGAGAWSEHEQKIVNDFLEHSIRLLQQEMAEKAQTILEILQHLDLDDKVTAELQVMSISHW